MNWSVRSSRHSGCRPFSSGVLKTLGARGSGHRTASLMPEAPLVLLDRASHAPYYERPEAFNDVLTDYLSDPKGYGAGVREVRAMALRLLSTTFTPIRGSHEGQHS